jgi:hypothetical protein
MKHIPMGTIGKAGLIVVVLLLLSGTVVAAGGIDINRSVIGGGGGHSVSGRYTIDATIGQAVAGTFDAASYELCAGFWCGLGEYRVYLPVIRRD